jgi:hypothetical protein
MFLQEWTLAHDLGFDAIHASFPCQSKTAYRRKGHGVGDGYPNLMPEAASCSSVRACRT